MKTSTWGDGVSDSDRRDQLKLIYDYIKFHISLYVATPAALSVIADAYEVKRETWFVMTLSTTIIIFIVAGAHAGLFMARHVIRPWQESYLDSFQFEAFSGLRSTIHHTLYWVGLGVGLTGLLLSVLFKDHVATVTQTVISPSTSTPTFALKDYATPISILITSLLAVWVTWKHNLHQKQYQADEFAHQKSIKQKEAHSALKLKAIDLHEAFWNSAELGKARQMISNETEYKLLAEALSKRTKRTECELTPEEYGLLETIDRFYSAIMRLRRLENSLAAFGDDPVSEKMIRDCYGYWVAILERPAGISGNRDELRDYLNRFWPGIVGCLPLGASYGAMV